MGSKRRNTPHDDERRNVPARATTWTCPSRRWRESYYLAVTGSGNGLLVGTGTVVFPKAALSSDRNSRRSNRSR